MKVFIKKNKVFIIFTIFIVNLLIFIVFNLTLIFIGLSIFLGGVIVFQIIIKIIKYNEQRKKRIELYKKFKKTTFSYRKKRDCEKKSVKSKKDKVGIKMTEGKRNIIAALLNEYDIESAEDIQDALKDLYLISQIRLFLKS